MERNPWEQEALKKLDDFLPETIFDTHTHISDPSFINKPHKGGLEYRQEMSPLLCNPRELRMNHIPFPSAAMADFYGSAIQASDRMLLEELNSDSGSVGELIVHPNETALSPHRESAFLWPIVSTGFIPEIWQTSPRPHPYTAGPWL